MKYDAFNTFCQSLPAATYVVQWGKSHVWKVGGKVFAIGKENDGEPSYTFKAGDISYELLKDQKGLRPAPYLASRGLKWIQQCAQPGLTDDELRGYIRLSYALVVRGLPKKKRAEFGLGTPWLHTI